MDEWVGRDGTLQGSGKRKRAERLHGAFTGGFSAGFHNTVGSKAGFQPATFVSRRGRRERLSNTALRYMDQEDKDDILDPRREELDVKHDSRRAGGERAVEAFKDDEDGEDPLVFKKTILKHTFKARTAEDTPQLVAYPQFVSAGHTSTTAESPMEKAARQGKYGHATRTTEAWLPSRLLYKRWVQPEATAVHGKRESTR